MPKRKAADDEEIGDAEVAKAVSKPKRVKVEESPVELIDASTKFTLNIERCNS